MNWELCRIHTERGEIEKLGPTVPGSVSNLTIHPDGLQVAYSAKNTPLPPAVWVMENFLPLEAIGQANRQ